MNQFFSLHSRYRVLVATLSVLLSLVSVAAQGNSLDPHSFVASQWRTSTGEAVASELIPTGRRWVALVIDASRGAPNHLSALNRANGDGWGSDLVLLAVGQPKDIDALFLAHKRLPPIRLRAVDGAVLRNSRLPGAPLLLGFDETGRLGWMESRSPRDRAELERWVVAWIGRPVNAVVE